jgi:electron transfer flavoprotein alpha subunit
VTAALQCGGDVHVLVAGANAGAAAAAAAAIAGVAKVLHADDAGLAERLAENVAAQVLAVASGYSHILFPATASGKNIAPRVAAKLDVGQISDDHQGRQPDTFERPIYAGNAIATVQSLDAVKVLTVRTTGFDAGGRHRRQRRSRGGGGGRQPQGQLRRQRDRQERPPRTHRGQDRRQRRPRLGSAEKFTEVLTPLADKLGAAMGASARRGRRRLRAQRLAGRPDRQDRRAPAVHGLRHQRRHPAPGRHEGQQGDRRDQQGRRGADLLVADYGLEADLFVAVPELVAAL